MLTSLLESIKTSVSTLFFRNQVKYWIEKTILRITCFKITSILAKIVDAVPSHLSR